MTQPQTRQSDTQSLSWVWQAGSTPQNLAECFTQVTPSRLIISLQSHTDKNLSWAKGTDTLTLGDQVNWIEAKGIWALLRALIGWETPETEYRVVSVVSNLQAVNDWRPVELSPYLKSMLSEVEGTEWLTVKQLRALKNFISEPSSTFSYNVEDLYTHDEF